MSLTPIVGEAIIRVRVTSDRLAANIRDAVNKGLGDADKDIDKRGQESGRKLSDGISEGVTQNRDKATREIGKELEVYSRRIVADSDGNLHDSGSLVGRRFSDGISEGVTSQRSVVAREVGKEIEVYNRRFVGDSDANVHDSGTLLGRRFVTGIGDGVNERGNWDRVGVRSMENFRRVIDPDGFDVPGHLIGNRFMRGIGNGIGDGQPELRQSLERGVVRELTSGSESRIREAGDINGRLFMRQLTAGVQKAAPDVDDVFRRTLGNAVRNQETDLRFGFQRVFVNGFSGTESLIRKIVEPEMRRGLRDATDNAGPEVDRSFLRTVRGLGLKGSIDWAEIYARRAARKFGDRLGLDMRTAGERAGDAAGNAAGNETDRGLRRSLNRNRGGLLTALGKIGNDLFGAFNIGFGAARMGPAIISVLTTAGPSILAGVGAILTALISEIITLAAAIGPGIAGAMGIGIAAVSTLALNFGLLTLAMSKAFKTVEGAKIKDALKEIGNLIGTPVANGLLEGMLDSVNRLKDAIPQLAPLLKQTGEAFGGVITRIIDTISSAANMSRIGTILTTNIGFVNNFKDGIGGLVESFLILFAASRPFIDAIGGAIKKFGEWAAASLSVSEANGNLATWMDGMLASFKDLAGIIGNFGKGIGDVFSAAGTAGETLLSSIRGIAERFHAWTSDTGNMEKMTAFFNKAHELSSKVFDVLGSIFTAGGNAFSNMDLGPIEHVLDTLQNKVGPAIGEFFNQIQAGGSENLVKAFDNIGTALGKIADSGSFEKVAGIISGLILKFTEFAATDFGSTILGIVLPLAVMGGIFTSLLGPVGALFSALGGGSAIMSALGAAAAALGAPVGVLVAVIAAAVGFFVLMWQNSERLRNAIGTLVTVVGGALISAWQSVQPHLERVFGKLQQLAGIIGDRLAPVIEFLTPIVERVFGFIGSIIGNIVDVIGGAIDIMAGILSGNWSQIWDGVKQVLSGAWDFIVTVFEGIKSAISFAWDAITAIIYNAGQVIVGIITSIGSGLLAAWHFIWDPIASFVTEKFAEIYAAVQGFLNSLPGIVQNGLLAAGQFFTDIWTSVRDFTVTKFAEIYAAVQGFLNSLPGIVQNALLAVGQFFTDIWNSIYNWTVTTFTNIYNSVRDWLNSLPGVAQTALNAVGQFFTDIWNSIVNWVTTTVTNIYNNVRDWLNKLPGVAQDALNAMGAFFTSIFQFIYDNTIQRVIDIYNGLVEWFGNADQWVRDKFSGFADWIGGVFTAAKDVVVGVAQDIYNGITGWIGDAVSAIQTAWQTIQGIVTQINDAIGRAAQAIVDAPSAASVGAGQATTGGVGLLGPTLDMLRQMLIANVTPFALGGVVSQPTLALIGESGRERVEPLDSSGMSARDRAMITTLVASLAGPSQGGDIHLHIGNEFVRTFVRQEIDKSEQSLARRVRNARPR